MDELRDLLARLAPRRRPGEYVVVDASDFVDAPALATIVEDEGVCAVLPLADALDAGLTYDFVMAWITLGVESSLGAVGLTAAVATALAERGISCNVLAGYHHDHLLVPSDRADEALAALEALASG
ncbi:MAG TPA: ACT domain-containing protein [Acidimicrobiales bacterium]|nr:ACT domain-containing protein [Acidimicrobiales bacterium]